MRLSSSMPTTSLGLPTLRAGVHRPLPSRLGCYLPYNSEMSFHAHGLPSLPCFVALEAAPVDSPGGLRWPLDCGWVRPKLVPEGTRRQEELCRWVVILLALSFSLLRRPHPLLMWSSSPYHLLLPDSRTTSSPVLRPQRRCRYSSALTRPGWCPRPHGFLQPPLIFITVALLNPSQSA